MSRLAVLSIAGFDPSAGAGILADIKAFQKHEVYGFGAITGLTIQNEWEVKNVQWYPIKEIIGQLEMILPKHEIAAVKIGVTESQEALEQIVSYLRETSPASKLVWDPVFKSSSGYCFWQYLDMDRLYETLDKLDLITPNVEEYVSIWGTNLPLHQVQCNASILLKSVSQSQDQVIDYLWWKQKLHHLKSNRLTDHDKHGTGCWLSSGIAAGLAQGLDVAKAWQQSKEHLNQYMTSSSELLGI